MSHRFVNRTGAPITLPSPRGGRHCFRSGEGTENPWYSRFVGDGMLSRETADGQAVHAGHGRIDTRARTNRKVRDSTLIVPPARIIEPAAARAHAASGASRSGGRGPSHTPVELLHQGCQVQCEQSAQAIAAAEHHVKVGRMLYCRYCDFHADDLSLMNGHTLAYHRDHVPPQVAPPPAAEVAAIVESHIEVGLGAPAEVVESSVIEVEMPVEMMVETGPIDVSTPAPETHQCEVCRKVFGTAKGLRMHRTRADHRTLPAHDP